MAVWLRERGIRYAFYGEKIRIRQDSGITAFCGRLFSGSAGHEYREEHFTGQNGGI